MYPVIEQIAQDTGISIEEADYVFKIITGELLGKVPQLEQIVDDVFAHVETDKLRKHIAKVIVLLQQEDTAIFKTWTMPEIAYRIPYAGSRDVL